MSDEPDASAATPYFEPPSLEDLALLLPQYEMQGFIAQGGMGAVYLARQPTLDRFVAIKVLPPDWGGEMDFAARFQIEARAMAKLQHSNIVSVYDFGLTQKGHLYLVMEYVHGQTLHEFIQSGGLTVQHALSYALQLCEALQYAHEHGIIHRDIKPSNVLINEDGRVKVADFGLARPAAAHDQEVMMGTPDYAAPEISEGLTVDHRADIFALGVLIYEMLTRTTPAQSRKPASVLAGVDVGWDEVITKATRPLAKDRFPHVKDMRAAISLIGNRHRYAPGAHPPQKASGSGGGVKLLLAGMLAGAVAIGGYVFLNRSHHEVPPSAGGNAPSQIAGAGQSAPSTAPPPSNPPPPSPQGEPPPKPRPVESSGPPPEPLHIDFVKAAPGYLGQYPLGHREPIWGIGLLPDGKRAVSASNDHFFKVWRLMTGELIRSTKVPGAITCMAVSGDGQYVAVGCDDSHVRIYDIDTGEMKAEASSTGKMTNGVAFSPDGRKIISVTSNNKDSPVQVWPWADRQVPQPLLGWSYPVSGLGMIPGGTDGRFATVGGLPKASADDPVQSELCVGNVDAATPLRVMKPLKGIPWRVSVSPDQKYVAIMSGNVPTLYDFQSQKELARCQGHSGRVDTMVFLDHGRLMLSGGEDRTMRIWDSATGKELWREGRNDVHATNQVAVNADETLVLTGGGTGIGGSSGKDSEFHLHLWKLPPLNTLHAGGAVMVASGNDLSSPSGPDPDLDKLKADMDAEWEAKIVKDAVAAREDLDKRYMDFLRKTLAVSSPSERPGFVNEISRVANNGPMPEAPPVGAPLSLQKSIKAYIEQVNLLKQKNSETARALLKANETRLGAIEALRKTQGDDKGAIRVKRLWLDWSKGHASETGTTAG